VIDIGTPAVRHPNELLCPGSTNGLSLGAALLCVGTMAPGLEVAAPALALATGLRFVL
jgi:hypothetical protein